MASQLVVGAAAGDGSPGSLIACIMNARLAWSRSLANWLLIVWLASNDPGFPDPKNSEVVDTFATHQACLKEGPKKVLLSRHAHIEYWACVEGGKAAPGKSGDGK